jgi:aryl-alcohol dehydrogenase-like predicted oxidoreductase
VEEGIVERRSLGRTGLSVSALGMGCGRIGSDPRPGALRSSMDAISLALASGINLFDTADVYGRGLSERLIGRAIKHRSDDVVIVTKCGMLKTPAAFLRVAARGLSNATDPSGLRRLRAQFKDRRSYEPGYVSSAANASLRRLGRDHIDLFLLHSPPSDVLEQGDAVAALETLKASGKIRSWGISVRSAEDASVALKLSGISAIEIPLNICQTHALTGALPKAKALGIAVIARQPFASGKVYRSWMRRDGSAGGEFKGLTERQLFDACLHFVLRAEGVSTAVAGMTKPEHVAANVDSALAGRATADEISIVQAALC